MAVRRTPALNWNRLASDLIAAGILTSQNADTLAVLCNAFARYRQATTMLDHISLLVKGSDSALVRNLLLAVQADAERTIIAPTDRFQLESGAPTPDQTAEQR